MSFNIVPKAGPDLSNSKQTSASESRERAIKALIGNSPQSQQAAPVANPSQVTPEEMTAVKAPSAPAEAAKADDVSTEDNRQSDKVSESDTPDADTKAKDPLSTQYAILARKEKALRAKVQELKAKEDSLKAAEEASKAKEADYQTKFVSKDRLTQDTLAVLNELGISYEQLTNLVLNQPKPEDTALLGEIRALKDEINALKGVQETSKKESADQQQKAYQQAVNQIRNDVKQLVTSNPDFETIKETGSAEDVVQLIEKTFHKDGILLTVEEAAKEVEEFLLEEAMKLTKIKKIQSRLQTKPEQKTEQKQVEPPKQPQPMKTLTNTVTTTRKLSARDRAMLAFKNELKD